MTDSRFKTASAPALHVPVEIGHFEFDRNDIIRFAEKFDPQAFHLEEAAANASILAGFSASGWHSCAVHHACVERFFRAQDIAGICDAYPEVGWLQPVRPDMRYTITLLSMVQANGSYQLVFETTDAFGNPTMRITSEWRFDTLAPQIAEQILPPPHSGGGLTFDQIQLNTPQFLGDYTFESASADVFRTTYGLAGPQTTVNQWHIAAAWMNRMITARDVQCDRARASALQIPQFGPAPGLKNLCWFGEVTVGETISYFTTPLSKRKTSRPRWALVSYANLGVNSRNQVILSFEASVFITTDAV